MSDDESGQAAELLLAYRQADSEHALTAAIASIASIASRDHEAFATLACGLLGLVAQRKTHCAQAEVSRLADLLRQQPPEQCALRVIAFLHHQRGDAKLAAAFQAQSLSAPATMPHDMMIRLAHDLRRASQKRESD